MSARPAEREHLGFDRLAWTALCLGLALLPQLTHLKSWISITIAVSVGIRLLLARSSRGLPPAYLRLAVSGTAIALLFLQFRTFNGIDAGSALLALMAGLKFLEARTLRDARIIILIVYFLSLASLLVGTSFGLLFYLLGVGWLTTAVLLRFTIARPAPAMGASVAQAGRLLALAAPLAVALWLFFPRFAGPLWQLPSADSGAKSGLSEKMSPGDLSELSLSDEVAMRVRFVGAVPAPSQRYWRGPVLDDFDGRSWTRSVFNEGHYLGATTATTGPSYRYSISLEPHQRAWLLALERPVSWDAPRAFLSADAVLMQTEPVSRPLDFNAVSRTGPQPDEPLGARERRRQTRLPAQRNPRTLELARQMRATAGSDAGFARAALQLFRAGEFFYTLTPPRLSDNPVDEFLFQTRRGFCEHYASAYATLMRAGGVPARVVTGYQGGEFNRFAGYWIVRQSDAHAWNEIWLEGRGWVRADPTAAIAPERIERGSAGFGLADGPSQDWYARTPWLADLRLRLDALRQRWRQAILQFDQRSQISILETLHVPEPDADKLVLFLAAALVLTSLWLTWQLKRDAPLRRRDPVLAAYRELTRKLACRGVTTATGDTALTLAAKARHALPAEALAVQALCERYNELRYGRAATQAGAERAAADIRQFTRAVRALKL